MEFRNNTRHISGLLLILALSMFACKKDEQHTSFYHDSVSPYVDRSDQSVSQPVLNTLDAFKFTNIIGTQVVMSTDSMPSELFWLKAQRSTDFFPINGAPQVDDNSRTQVRALYDAGNLYLAVYCWDQKMTSLPTPPAPADGQDYRNRTDVVLIYLLAPGSNFVYIIQVTPQGVH